MTNNLTSVSKNLLTDILLTGVETKASPYSDAAIQNISDEVEVLSKSVHSVGTEKNPTEKSGKNFIIPEGLGRFSISTKNYFNTAQRWVGHIIRLNESSFTAKLEDLSSPTTYEVAEFNYKEVPSDDKDYINIGNVFYWSVGYNVNNGQVLKASVLKFQRLPVLDTEEINRKIGNIDEAIDRADNLLNDILWD